MKLELNKIYKITLDFNLQQLKNEYYEFIGQIHYKEILPYSTNQMYNIKLNKILKDPDNFLTDYLDYRKPILYQIKPEWIIKAKSITKEELAVYLL